MKNRLLTVLLSLAAVLSLLAGCEGSDGGSAQSNTGGGRKALNYEDAAAEVEAYYRTISPTTHAPQLDTDVDLSTAAALADINTFPVTTAGRADVTVEIAVSTELSDTSEPDNWANVVAASFNRKGYRLEDGQTVAVSIRKIASGETVTYMTEGNYRPVGFIPSHDKWGEMLQSKGFEMTTLTNRLVGNTAGILMKNDIYETYAAKYGEITVKGVMDATLNGDLVFATTNPYTSSTGLNLLVQMLSAYDANNPLSDEAITKLTDYQKIAPTAAYTTAVMRESAKKGVIGAMAMEEQAYVNNAELRNYVYVPVGFRHDHPVYVFNYASGAEQEAMRMFVTYCLEAEQQKLATDRGFNRHDDYAGQPTMLKGGDFFSAQNVWKRVKNGGRPVVAVFIADVSGSMQGRRLASLKESLLKTMQYVSPDNYIGLVSYNDNVSIDLPVAKFDNTQRAYFSGAVKDLAPNGKTATYSATTVGLKMLLDAAEKTPDAQLMLFVLTDGEQNVGYSLSKIEPLVKGLGVPIHAIAYETSSTSELQKLSSWNEAAMINADVDGIVNELRKLFTVNM